MRLRHKKNAETQIFNCPLVINCYDANNIIANNHNDNFLDLNKIFNNSNPISLELGMGKGRFIAELSKRNSDINYIGIEKSATIILKAVDKLSRNKAQSIDNCTNIIDLYPNLRFMCLNIEKIGEVFENNTIDKIYLNFSDPWPKKRHKSRRLTHLNFLNIYEKILKKNGIIEFKTDNTDLFDFTLDEIKLSNFNLIDLTYDLHNDEKLNVGNIMTEYEEKFNKNGNKICKLITKSN